MLVLGMGAKTRSVIPLFLKILYQSMPYQWKALGEAFIDIVIDKFT